MGCHRVILVIRILVVNQCVLIEYTDTTQNNCYIIICAYPSYSVDHNIVYTTTHITLLQTVILFA